MFVRPILIVGVECLRYSAPPGVFDKDGLLFRRGVAVFGFEDFKEVDRGDIIAELLALRPFADPVGFGDAIV